MKEKFAYFGPATFVYAIFYVFCTYENPSGIMFPIFIVGSLVYLCMALEKLDVSLKKDSLFYLVSMMLLGVSTFCTDDRRIIMLNKTGIFGLVMVLLLRQFYDTSGWQLRKHLDSMLRLMFVSLGEIGRPFSDGVAFCKSKNKVLSKKTVYVLMGIGIALPILFVVLFLLASADAVFWDILTSLLDGIRIGDGFGDAVNTVFRVLVCFTVVYAWLAFLSAAKLPENEEDKRIGEPIIAITVTSILSAVYLLFCGIQVVYLFFGKMSLPAGYTYAGYAREGFFQLLAVSVINLVIVLVCHECFRDSRVLKIILTIMSLSTFIMIASSALRMIMYIRYYFLTFQRVFVLWSLAVLFLIFLGVVVSICKRSFPLFHYSVAVVTVLYLFLSFSHPDYFIAKVNIANAAYEGMEEWNPQDGDFFQSGDPYQDYDYLKNMSADAAPVLIPFIAKQGVAVEDFYRDDVFENYAGRNTVSHMYDDFYFLSYLNNMKERSEDFSWRTYNVSRHMMLRLIEKYSE